MAAVKTIPNFANCNDPLSHTSIIVTLKFLEEHNVPYHVIFQEVGDIVILFYNVIHFGFNLGYNIAEAVNVAYMGWKSVFNNFLEGSNLYCKCDNGPPNMFHADVFLKVNKTLEGT